MTNLKIPSHIGIIMDGNGRWAKMQNKKRIFGHEKGAEVAEKIIQYSTDIGVRYLTLYSFSTENWKRPKDEVNFLFKLFIKYLETRLRKIISKGVKMRFSGNLSELPQDVQKSCKKIQEISKDNKKLDLIMALNYGGRQEIINAANNAIKNGKSEITEDDISLNLYLPDVPDPDLIIRTSGEIRLSNFLLWQSAYSELYFTKKLWPDFTENDYLEAIKEYTKRDRRFGGIGSDENANR
ncbi:isoprenyl transferase [Tepiditoga spiralis]|uniref:Isoprenyl transferase n=1 Tax=Tepiditoga spiralis TaxID=2108365 RepID=A0A7G1GAT2_9BACT|nr:isoprenyl transferase [Tepiditoga spiralis]BBE30649.1 isoprenyl transferase [Tepiditoga spiralis]